MNGILRSTAPNVMLSEAYARAAFLFDFDPKLRCG